MSAQDRRWIRKASTVAGVLGGLTVLLVLGCAEERPPIQQGTPPEAAASEARVHWTMECVPVADCPFRGDLRVTLAPGGRIFSVDGIHIPNPHGSWWIHDGQLFITVHELSVAFLGVLDSSGNRAEGMLNNHKAFAVRAFSPQGTPPEAVENTDVAGVWTITCNTVSADCPGFKVSFGSSGDVADFQVGGHSGPAKGVGGIRNGTLSFVVNGVWGFSGTLDENGQSATGNVTEYHADGANTTTAAVAVRGNPICDTPQGARMKSCR
jgi:hypothetical protein